MLVTLVFVCNLNSIDILLVLFYSIVKLILLGYKTRSLHQAQNIHLSCAVSSVIWFWNMDNAQSRQWQDPVFSHAGTASYLDG